MTVPLKSLGARHDYDDLEDAIESMKDALPPGVIPFGCNSFGDQVCLALAGENRERVYLWNHEGRPPRVDPRVRHPWLDLGDDVEFKPDDWPGYPDLTLLAESFRAFRDAKSIAAV